VSVVLDALKRAEREHPAAIIITKPQTLTAAALITNITNPQTTSISKEPFQKNKLLETKKFYRKIFAGIILFNLIWIAYITKPQALFSLKPKPLPVPVQKAIPIYDASIPQVVSIPVISTSVLVPEIKAVKKERNYLSISNGPEIRINGVFLEKHGSFVLFEDEMLSVGENLNGTTITAITMNKVTLEYKGCPYEINT